MKVDIELPIYSICEKCGNKIPVKISLEFSGNNVDVVSLIAKLLSFAKEKKKKEKRE